MLMEAHFGISSPNYFIGITDRCVLWIWFQQRLKKIGFSRKSSRPTTATGHGLPFGDKEHQQWQINNIDLPPSSLLKCSGNYQCTSVLFSLGVVSGE